MKVAILTSPKQWFIPFAKELSSKINNSNLFFDHTKIDQNYDILFILSYHKIIDSKYLNAKHNIIIHASDLPKGKGWSPMFWQILEGKNEIVFSMFEASDGVDDGDIYMKKTLHLNGFELNEELRFKQANFINEMCLEFFKNNVQFSKTAKQTGKESFYLKRSSKDSKLDITKTIEEQFNLLRIVDNENYPAFFYKDGEKYILKIEKG
jgi:methionyl-tRNA formyltransferase